MKRLKYIKLFENFEAKNFKDEVYDNKDLFDKIKKDLESFNWIQDGIGTDSYELFGREDSKDLEEAIEYGEISIDNAVEEVQSKLEDRYKESGVTIDVDTLGNDDTLFVKINLDDDFITFEIGYYLN
jgi:hypothetical protein